MSGPAWETFCVVVLSVAGGLCVALAAAGLGAGVAYLLGAKR